MRVLSDFSFFSLHINLWCSVLCSLKPQAQPICPRSSGRVNPLGSIFTSLTLHREIFTYSGLASKFTPCLVSI